MRLFKDIDNLNNPQEQTDKESIQVFTAGMVAFIVAVALGCLFNKKPEVETTIYQPQKETNQQFICRDTNRPIDYRTWK